MIPTPGRCMRSLVPITANICRLQPDQWAHARPPTSSGRSASPARHAISRCAQRARRADDEAAARLPERRVAEPRRRLFPPDARVLLRVAGARPVRPRQLSRGDRACRSLRTRNDTRGLLMRSSEHDRQSPEEASP